MFDLRGRILADVSSNSGQYPLERSLDPLKTIEQLKNHELRKWDIQYIFMIPILAFCFLINYDVPFVLRLAFALALGVLLIIPATSQFWLPFMPIATYLVLFFSSGKIPADYRPAISVRILPALETILYGGDLSQVLASSTNALLDLLAWIPYGLGHFGVPFIVSPIIFLFSPPGTLPVWAFAFGWMNVTGVCIQILFPTAPPWYQNLYGLNPANYSMQGSPGGLERIDKLLGLNLYSGAFSTSPMIFGAFPSLHSGSAVMEALVMSHVFPKFRPYFFGYVLWIWWSTMYLTHHYFIDLTAGAVLSFIVFYFVKLTCLPQIQSGKLSRWAYDYIEIGFDSMPTKFRKSMDYQMYEVEQVQV